LKEDLTKAKLPTTPPKYLGKNGATIWKYLVPFLNKNKKVHSGRSIFC